ncbi:MAG: HlyD family efflux transporter periplasmic adaptor subunit [Sporichthyaceae bacterium]
MEKKKIAIHTGLTVVLAATAVQGVRMVGNPGQPEPVEQTAPVELGTVASTVTAAGNLNAPKTVGLVFADPEPGLVTAVDVEIGDSVKKGQKLAKVDDRPAKNELAAANAAVLAAKAQLVTAKEQLRAGRSQVGAAAQIADNAELAVEQAAQRLKLTAGTSKALVRAAERRLDAAGNDVSRSRQRSASASRERTAETKIAPPPPGPTEITITDSRKIALENTVTASTSRSAVAEAGAETVQARTERATALLAAEQEIDAKIGEAELARRNVGVAASAAGLDRRYGTPGVILTAKAAMASAKAQVAAAKTSLSNTVLRAPVEGTIVHVAGSVGETPVSDPRAPSDAAATPSGPGSVENRRPATGSGFVVMADLTHREVTVLVDEADIGKVEKGQKAVVTFPSTGVRVPGTVRAQDVQETVLNNVLQYRVQIALDEDAATLKLGQSAEVVITTAERKNVLEVPSEAVRQAGDRAVLTVKRGENNVTVPVTVGLVGDTTTEVSSPLLKPGDVVVLGAGGGAAPASPAQGEPAPPAREEDPARPEDTGSPEGHGH